MSPPLEPEESRPQLGSESVPRRGNYGARDFVYYDGPDHYAELENRGYDPGDFSYYEDAQRRGTALAIFGAILLVVGILGPGNNSELGPFGVGFSNAFIGALIAAFLASALLIFLAGEASMAAFSAGLILVVLGLISVAHPAAPWLWSELLLILVGAGCVPIGVILFLEARQRNMAMDSAAEAGPA